MHAMHSVFRAAPLAVVLAAAAGCGHAAQLAPAASVPAALIPAVTTDAVTDDPDDPAI